MKSLKDQFLKAGLVDKNTVKQTRKQKQAKQPKEKRGLASESARLAEQALRDKTQKDKELNRQRQQESEQKAQLAQIKQLVDGSKIDRDRGEVAYNFTQDGKIKTIYVTDDQQKQLMRKQIAIVSLANDKFEIVPNVVALKIHQRNENYVIAIKSSSDNADENDPYADYQIPDDLVW